MIEIRPGLVLPDSVLEWPVSRAGGPGGQQRSLKQGRKIRGDE